MRRYHQQYESFRKIISIWSQWFVILLVSTASSSHLFAASVSDMEVSSKDGEYSIRLEMTLDVPAKYVREVLTDYRHIYRLNPSIIESRMLQLSETGKTRVYTKISDCVLFFCKEISRVEEVVEHDNGMLVAKIIPEGSDFDSGITKWEISDINEKTKLVYDTRVQPNFFIPPIIGNYIVEGKMKDSLMASFQRIECNARIKRLIAETKNDVVNTVKRKMQQCQV